VSSYETPFDYEQPTIRQHLNVLEERRHRPHEGAIAKRRPRSSWRLRLKDIADWRPPLSPVLDRNVPAWIVSDRDARAKSKRRPGRVDARNDNAKERRAAMKNTGTF